MKPRTWCLFAKFVAAICVLVALGIASAGEAWGQTMLDLTPGEYDWGRALGINEAGQVVGDYWTEAGHGPFVWTDGEMTGLSESDGYTSGINDLGQVAGYSGAIGSGHAFLWADGEMTDLAPGSLSYAYGINNLGQVVGCFNATASSRHAFLWTDEGMTDLTPDTPNNGYACAYGINDQGQVVGEADSYAVLWTDGVMTVLPGASPLSSAYGINNLGDVVGVSGSQAVLWTDGEMINLTNGASWASAWGINDLGQVVGESDGHASLWTDGEEINLTPGAFFGGCAYGINEAGQVVGHFDVNGWLHAFLWPAPSPVLTVAIDIKPGSYPNSVNLGSRGVVPVAILSTAELDATQVDPLTVTLAGAAVRLRGNGSPQASFQDANGDGLLDLVVQVESEDLQLTPADTEATLAGATFDGQAIEGTDLVNIVP